MAGQPKQPPQQRRQDVLAVLLVLAGLYWFAASFFLAKRSLVQTSACDEAAVLLRDQLGLTAAETDLLVQQGIIMPAADAAAPQMNAKHRRGCWMERRVDSVIILLVDALRFDFAYYNLPQSIGKRLTAAADQSSKNNNNGNKTSSSRLFQFIADPPTVTMQRLKALTTGGLPTFADISANFGGATVPEDSWVKQLFETPHASRGLQSPAKVGFVGDDTWEDLFPNYFTESYPYPSFNTRDLDTVDNGCLSRLPALLRKLRTGGASDAELEVVIVHFLGVDHVGHTYGPHNAHMDAKLGQMDAALHTVLDLLDESDHCHAALIFGDHGMTAEGNHGGGTPAETHAALFVHASPACGTLPVNTAPLERQAPSAWVAHTFAAIHQIDLVPVLALLLGLPIPYANLGGVVPSLLPNDNNDDHLRHATAALALNAAQVHRYFTVYSATANRLPHLPALRESLLLAVASYREALQQPPPPDAADDVNDDKYVEAATLFKAFLTEALELGQRVWTRFDTFGMVGGMIVLAAGLVLYALPLLTRPPLRASSRPLDYPWEMSAAVVFMLYQCGLLTFSNSYILEEEDSIMYCLAVLSIVVALRMQGDPVPSSLWRGVALLPVASRLSELFVSGHGLDPSIRLHGAHSAVAFLTSLALLAAFRWHLYRRDVTPSLTNAVADCAALICFAASWWEKRSLDPDRNGFWASRIALTLLFGGLLLSIGQAVTRPSGASNPAPAVRLLTGDVITILAKVLIAIMAVTGPSAASSLVAYTFQATVIYCLAMMTGPRQVHPLVIAALWRLVTRHVFFATNHGCFFNRLQYSAAFIVTKEFYFVTGGISLFLNTFGWEMVGIVLAWLMSQHLGRSQIWRAYGVYQLVEALTSCISVSVLRRHLMVWDIYAPHFLFAAIFTVLSMLSRLTALAMSEAT